MPDRSHLVSADGFVFYDKFGDFIDPSQIFSELVLHLIVPSFPRTQHYTREVFDFHAEVNVVIDLASESFVKMRTS
jgi:hypothetical protein